ncbi:Txe/YoeB family addiction module toxin [Peptoniphilus sp.]|uniref:Txe/YoeB family addiction module toxin n=1 Tax=Peptoniphilus sp. TaxID=1971214 RepID=UPI002A83D4E6|nr:Txe/YoeB family addiction module toxin [Peptoniphilus sp.]MDY3903016.1 Txe/YoeB family addiction module toxin [Peptoniphilus sp.]
MSGNYKILITKDAKKDKEKIKSIPSLKKNVENLINVIKDDPYKNPPRYEKLKGNLEGLYSRRINNKHRLVYQVYEDEKVVKIVSMWSHYEF